MSSQKSFALLGAAGYVAPRHMKAIKETGHLLTVAYDPFDSVGIIDSYFPEAAFFVEFERFDRHIEKLRRNGRGVDYMSVCSPNYLHDAHCRAGLRAGADVICEKPLVLNPWNIDALREIEEATSKNIYTILQLRLHPSVIALKKMVEENPDKVYDINLSYLTSRGNWYYTSWKGDVKKSGGIATNIGVHFFDMLMWIFGNVQVNDVYQNSHDRAAGYLQLERARVNWFLSINYDLIPEEIKKTGARIFRSLTIGDMDFDFSAGFTDLHTLSYQNIIDGAGFGLEESRKAIQLVHDIRNKELTTPPDTAHPLSFKDLAPHPFKSSR